MRTVSAFPIIALLVLAGTTIAMRLPYVFPAVIDWDESTYIIMGQGILEGKLPYVHTWEMKPPLAFLPFAAIIALFGKDIIAIRIGAMLLVFATGYLTFVIGSAIWSRRAGIFAGVLCIVFISTIGQPLYTEIIALVPLTAALLLLLQRPRNTQTLFFTGLLLSMASLVRLNLVYVPLFIGVYFCIRQIRYPAPDFWRGLSAYIAGGLSVVALTAIPYIASDHIDTYFSSVFLAPLHYSSGGHDLIDSLTGLAHKGFEQNWPLWGASLLGFGWLGLRWRHLPVETRGKVLMIGVFLVSTLWSIFSTGRIFTHYLIQVVPLLSLPAGAALAALTYSRYKLPNLIVISLVLVVPVVSVFDMYATVADRFAAGKPLRHGTAYTIADFMRRENPQKAPVYFMTDHIVYWLTDTWPLTKATTHPSVVAKEYILQIIEGEGSTTEVEMARILDMKPLFIVKNRGSLYLRDKPGALKLLNDELKENYIRVAKIQKARIYKRIEGR